MAHCPTCRFWTGDREHALHGGECKRHAPTRGITGTPAWPWTYHTDWCGDHEPIANAAGTEEG